MEETLPIERPFVGDFRPSQWPASTYRSGSTVMVLHGAAHRDPRQFDDPPTFEVAPSNVRRSWATRFIGEQQNG